MGHFIWNRIFDIWAFFSVKLSLQNQNWFSSNFIVKFRYWEKDIPLGFEITQHITPLQSGRFFSNFCNLLRISELSMLKNMEMENQLVLWIDKTLNSKFKEYLRTICHWKRMPKSLGKFDHIGQVMDVSIDGRRTLFQFFYIWNL